MKLLSNYSEDDVTNLLSFLNLSEFCIIFKKNEVDGRTLENCFSVKHIKELGIDITYKATVLLNKIEEIKKNEKMLTKTLGKVATSSRMSTIEEDDEENDASTTLFREDDEKEEDNEDNKTEKKIFNIDELNILQNDNEKKIYLDNVDLEATIDDGWRPIHLICRYSTPEIIKYIIDKNVIDLEATIDDGWRDGWRPIHLICRYSTPEIIKYIIDKNVIDLEVTENVSIQRFSEEMRELGFEYQKQHGYSTYKISIDELNNIAKKRKWLHELDKDLLMKPTNDDNECMFIDKTDKAEYYSTPEIIKYIIDKNVIDLEAETNDGWKPIHFICRYSTPEIIKYIIDKNVIDLEAKTNDGWKPIHFICRYSTPEIIKYIIDKNVVDLEAETNDGWRPIHLICRYSTLKIIQYIFDKSIDLEAQLNDGWRPIHLICRYSTPKIIKYIIDKGVVDLEAQINDGWRPIHFICKKLPHKVIQYIINKSVNLRANQELTLSNLVNKKDKQYKIPFYYYLTLELIKYIINKNLKAYTVTNLIAESTFDYKNFLQIVYYHCCKINTIIQLLAEVKSYTKNI